MTTRARVRRLAAGLIAVPVATGLLTTGCGATAQEKGSDMDSTQARSHLEKTFSDVLASTGTDGTTPVKQSDKVPCGGAGGNEFSKIKTHLLSGVKPVSDAGPAFTAAKKLLDERHFTVGEITTKGTAQVMQFHDADLSASLTHYPDTQVLVLEGETTCLDNAGS